MRALEHWKQKFVSIIAKWCSISVFDEVSRTSDIYALKTVSAQVHQS